MFHYATAVRWMGAAILVAALAIDSAHAASSILIWPVNPVIAAEEKATALWLENRGASAVHLQVRVVGWKQTGNENVYSDQRDVLGTPPIMKIEAGQRQLVRLTRMSEVAAGSESAYRIIVDEIPTEESLAEGASGPAVNFQMRYSVPLFVEGAGFASKKAAGAANQAVAAPELVLRVVRSSGKAALEVRNIGALHARLAEVEFVAADGKKSAVSDGLLGYVLPGATMVWPLKDGVKASATLRAKLNEIQEPVQLSVAVP